MTSPDSYSYIDPMYHQFEAHFPDRHLRLGPLSGVPENKAVPKGAKKGKMRRNRNQARYKTQPITFDEIKEVDEEKEEDTTTKKGDILSQLTAFSRSMDGLMPTKKNLKLATPLLRTPLGNISAPLDIAHPKVRDGPSPILEQPPKDSELQFTRQDLEEPSLTSSRTEPILPSLKTESSLSLTDPISSSTKTETSPSGPEGQSNRDNKSSDKTDRLLDSETSSAERKIEQTDALAKNDSSKCMESDPNKDESKLNGSNLTSVDTAKSTADT
ncbi:unnamed protein product [Owenia fusiformis]|uniref:Uncharacterized protein n=1 Tax=Owenia fusiformis TaxID=6347 RepID=A0A8J1TBZ4_OWEFU|nr:unnamed protein product [Owenia fusiformis]